MWLDGNANGIQDPGEAGIGNVTVRLFAPGPDGIFGTGDDVRIARTVTDTDGRYGFAIIPGVYEVCVDTSTMPAGLPGTQTFDPDVRFDSKTQVTVTAGTEVRPADFGYNWSTAGLGCPGDCNGDGAVRVNELVLIMNIALGERSLAACPAGDPSRDGVVTIDEIVMVVNGSLHGCPVRTPSATPNSTATPTLVTIPTPTSASGNSCQLMGDPNCRIEKETSCPAVARISTRPDGRQANGPSAGGALSGDGSCVAFYSDAANLLPAGPGADTNQARDVFVADLMTDMLARVSVATGGSQANAPSQAEGFLPDVDRECSCVAFSSDATNLVAGDTNRWTDVFVRDLAAGITTRISQPDGAEANGPSTFPRVSRDCSVVAFQSSASNLVPDDTNRFSDIFVYKRASGRMARVNVGPGGRQANGISISPSLSADGRCVAFASGASNLFDGDTNGNIDIYVACDGVVTCRASVDSAGQQANDVSFLPSLSGDGRYVAFKSLASNLVPGDCNGVADSFVHDCLTGRTEIVSRDTCGTRGNDASFPPTISADGRVVVFGSFATNFVRGQSVRNAQLYAHDRLYGTTSLVSSTSACGPANAGAPDVPASVSDDGRFVGFTSFATDLVAGDTNEVADVFFREIILAAPLPCRQDDDCADALVCVENECRLP